MTGHTELIGHRVRNLQSRLFAEGVVYQRVAPVLAETTQRSPRIARPPAVAQQLLPRDADIGRAAT